MLDGRYPFRVSVPGQPPLDAMLVVSGRSWSVTMYPWDPASPGSPLTIAGESQDALRALLLLVGATSGPASSPSTTAPAGIDTVVTHAAERATAPVAATPQHHSGSFAPSIVGAGTDAPGRGIVYHLATGGIVHMLTLLGNSLAYAESRGALVVPVFETAPEWGDVPFREFFSSTSPAIADAELQETLLGELPMRLGLPVSSHRAIRATWVEGGSGDCVELSGDLAGRLTLGLPWDTGLGPGQAVLTGGAPWPPAGAPSGFAESVERIAVGDRVRDAIAAKAAALPDRYIGVHFRNTDIASDLAEVTGRVRQAARDTGLADVVWVTDDIDTAAEAAGLLSGLRVHRTSDLPGIRGTGLRALHFMNPEDLAALGLTKDDINVAAMQDLYALVRAEVFVPTGPPRSGMASGWTGFVEHLRARPETAEAFFRLPVSPPSATARSRNRLHVPQEEPSAVRARMNAARASSPEPDPGSLLAARASLGDPGLDRSSFAAFAAFAEPLAAFSTAPDFEDLWALWETRGRNGACFVELGSGNGQDGSATALLERRAFWSGILVEPDPALAGEARMSRGCIVHQAWPGAVSGEDAALAVDEAAGRRRLVRVGRPTGRSRRKQPTAAMTVRTMTLDEILSAGTAPERIDVLFLRTGDAAIDLLRGFDFGGWDVRSVAVGEGVAGDAAALDTLLRSAGFGPAWPEFSRPSLWYTRA